MRFTACVPLVVVLVACTRASAELGPPSPASPLPAPVTAAGAEETARTDASAGASGSSLAAPCVHPAYQPTLCLNEGGPLKDEDARAWVVKRGVPDGALPKDFPGYEARCTEVALGAAALPTLACTIDSFAPGPLGGDGPMIWHRDLRLLGVEGHSLVERLRLPIGFTEALQWGAQTLFAAHFAVDAPAGSVTLDVSAEDCAAARKGVTGYHTDWIPATPDQPKYANARRAQVRLDVARIDRTCKAAGTYTLAKNGRLALTR